MINVTREHLLDLKTAAKQFGVTVQTVRNWAYRQTSPRLETVKIGGMVRTSSEALQRFVIQSEATSQELANIQSTYKSETDLAHEDAMRRLREVHGLNI